jgi:hypothetical protein
MNMGIWLAGATVVALMLGLAYNSLVVKRNQVRNVFSTVDVLLKKRCDLIPNLVATVQGYARHERGLLQELTELRSRAMSARLAPEESLELNARIGALIGGVRIAVEAYPDLKASRNFPAVAGGAERGGGADLRRTPGVQRRGDDLQQQHADRAAEPGGRNGLGSGRRFYFEAVPGGSRPCRWCHRCSRP